MSNVMLGNNICVLEIKLNEAKKGKKAKKATIARL